MKVQKDCECCGLNAVALRYYGPLGPLSSVIRNLCEYILHIVHHVVHLLRQFSFGGSEDLLIIPPSVAEEHHLFADAAIIGVRGHVISSIMYCLVQMLGLDAVLLELLYESLLFHKSSSSPPLLSKRPSHSRGWLR